MAYTQLQPAATPGRTYSFTAKSEAEIPTGLCSVGFTGKRPAAGISGKIPQIGLSGKRPGVTFST